MAITTDIQCEACGGPGAKLVTPPCGGEAEMCAPCLRDEYRQAAIDARWAELADRIDVPWE